MTQEKLTKREQEVLALISHGKRNKEIACELIVTENTIESHLKTIFKKLCVRNRVEAARNAVEMTTYDS